LEKTALRAANLFCERDGRLLFRELDFSLNTGEIMQVDGPNGSGKTTLLRWLSGLSNRCQGELFWHGQPLETARDLFIRQTVYLGHEAGIKLLLSPVENLRWYCTLQAGIDQEGIVAALEKAGLAGFEDTPCRNLSAGQRRRVAIARLLLSKAVFWILDEPFTAIDKTGVAELEQIIAGHVQQGGMVLLTTHHKLQVSVPLRRLTLGAF
jgi:heme exporter protein A